MLGGMSIAFPLSDDTRERITTPSNGATAIPVPFYFQKLTDIAVSREATMGAEDWVDLVPGSAYTLTGANVPSGGTITLVTPADGAHRYRVQGLAALDRLTSVMQGGSVKGILIDKELDRTRIIQQEQRRSIAATADAITAASNQFAAGLATLAGSVAAAAASAAQADAAADAATVAAAIQYHSIGLYDVPVAPADATAAMNAAAAASEGSDLFIPQGVEVIVEYLELPGNIHLINNGKITRKAGAIGNRFVSASWKGGVRISGTGQFDGNKDNQTDGNGAHNLGFYGCWDVHVDPGLSFVNALRNSDTGYGSGIAFDHGLDGDMGTRSSIRGVIAANNGALGISVNRSPFVDTDCNTCVLNHDGIAHSDYRGYDDQPELGSSRGSNIRWNTCSFNAGTGISAGHYVESYLPSGKPIFGPDHTNFVNGHVDGNTCERNGGYGIAYQGKGGTMIGNIVKLSGNASPDSYAADYLVNASDSICDLNISDNAAYYGLDAGGSRNCSFNGWKVFGAGGLAGHPGPGMNLGGTQDCSADDCEVHVSGSGTAFTLPGIEGDGASPFPQIGARTAVRRAKIYLGDPNARGVVVGASYQQATVEDCEVFGAFTYDNAFIFEAPVKQRNNRAYDGSWKRSISSASKLVVPDFGEVFSVTGTTNISDMRSKSQDNLHNRVSYLLVTSTGDEQYDQDDLPDIVFSGGGGSDASARLEVDNKGRPIGATMLNNGSGYTSAPSVTLVGGSGSGATLVARVGTNPDEAREVELMFEGALTVSNGGDLTMGSSLSTAVNSILRLRSKGTQWIEASRNGIHS